MRQQFVNTGFLAPLLAVAASIGSASGQSTSTQRNAQAPATARSDAAQERKAAEWIDSLNLDDADKQARLQVVVVTHLKTILVQPIVSTRRARILEASHSLIALATVING